MISAPEMDMFLLFSFRAWQKGCWPFSPGKTEAAQILLKRAMRNAAGSTDEAESQQTAKMSKMGVEGYASCQGRLANDEELLDGFQTHTSKICSLCNQDENEDIEHFVGRCPILREFRLLYFGKNVLSHEDIINILNGTVTNFKALASYIKSCTAYRKCLIYEFNS